MPCPRGAGSVLTVMITQGRVAPKPNVTNVAAMRPVVANAAASTSSAVPPRRNRSGMLPSKSAAIRRAMKSGQVKQKANKLRMPRGPLYVGNVSMSHLTMTNAIDIVLLASPSRHCGAPSSLLLVLWQGGRRPSAIFSWESHH